MNAIVGFFKGFNSELNNIFEKKNVSEGLRKVYKAGVIFVLIHTLISILASPFVDFNSFSQNTKYIIAYENLVYITVNVYLLVSFIKMNKKS